MLCHRRHFPRTTNRHNFSPERSLSPTLSYTTSRRRFELEDSSLNFQEDGTDHLPIAAAHDHDEHSCAVPGPSEVNSAQPLYAGSCKDTPSEHLFFSYY